MTQAQQKAIINESELPPFTVFKDGTFGYRLRYRIVSSDRNSFSQYSNIYTVRPNYLFERVAGKPIDEISVIRIGPYINVIWDSVLIKDRVSKNLIKRATQYDLWLNWNRGENNAEWVLADQVDGIFQGAVIPSSYRLTNGTVVEQQPTTLGVQVFLRSTVPSRNSTALLAYSKSGIDISVPLGDPNV